MRPFGGDRSLDLSRDRGLDTSREDCRRCRAEAWDFEAMTEAVYQSPVAQNVDEENGISVRSEIDVGFYLEIGVGG